jgi:hydrogenase maturation protease
MNTTYTGARNTIPAITKIIGIGQTFRGDDAVGPAAVNLWQKIFPASAMQPDIIVELLELPGISLLNVLKGANRAVLVDAVCSAAEPGTIHTITEDQLESFDLGARSAHGWGVAETIALGRKLNPAELPTELILIGIEADQIEMGEGLSQNVEMALPRVADLIEQIVRRKTGSVTNQSRFPRTSPK